MVKAYQKAGVAGQLRSAGLVNQAYEGMKKFKAAQESGRKTFWGPLFSTIDLLGIALAANPLTHQLPAQQLSFFQTSRGQIGQGFTGQLGYELTNLDGAPGQLPSGYSFVSFGVGLCWNTQIPAGMKDNIDRYTSLAHVRHSHRWEMGASYLWTCAEFHAQSPSVATTFANQLIEYATNGRTGMRMFPEEGRIYFPSKDVIRFDINLNFPIPVFATTDGLTWNGIAFGAPGSNACDPDFGIPIALIMEGVRFEELTA